MRDEKKCHALEFFDVILFSTWQKTSTWCKSVRKWPILDNLIRLIWKRSVWPYNEDDILAICTADKNFTYYIMKSTTCVVQLRKSHVDKWGGGGSEFSPGDQVLIEWLLLWTRREWLSSPATREKISKQQCRPNGCYRHFCDGGFTTQTHFEMHLITILIESDFNRLAGDINIMIVVN